MPLPAWAGPAISVGADILGGLFGKDDGPSFMTQVNDQKTAMDKLIPAQIHAEARAKDEVAKMYGIHPLVLFGSGMNSGYSPTFQYDNDRGFDWESMGQNVGRVADAVSTKGERAFQQTMQALGLRRAQLENDLLASQISSINRSGMPPRPGAVYSVDGQAQADVATPYGPIHIDNKRTSAPRHAYLHEADGTVIPILNPDSGDNEILMGWDFINHTLPAEMRNLARRSFNNIRGKARRLHAKMWDR